MTDIKPMRRTYRGVWFRSTLEADWAATLDSLGITWQYEPEAYQTPAGIYSPDFWLPAQRTWLEVKGPHYERMDKFEAFQKVLAASVDATVDISKGYLPEDPDHPDLPIALLGLPSENGLVRIHAGNVARCWQCENYSLISAFRETHWCRVCWSLGPCVAEPHIRFRHARDEGGG